MNNLYKRNEITKPVIAPNIAPSYVFDLLIVGASFILPYFFPNTKAPQSVPQQAKNNQIVAFKPCDIWTLIKIKLIQQIKIYSMPNS